MKVPIFSLVMPNSSITACMAGTLIELPSVDMNPVNAVVNVIVHFFLLDQLRALSGEFAKLFNDLAALLADREVIVGRRGWRGTWNTVSWS